MSAALALQKNLLLAGEYRLVRRLGFGAIGEVWAARNETIGREVAIKFVRPRARASAKYDAPDAFEAFERGVRESGKLRHPCIAELLDLLKIDGTPCIVTPLLEAEKLNALLARRGKLGVGASLRLVGELAKALSYAHEHGVVHGRVAPANVLLHRDARGQTTPILVDFGVARFVDPASLPGVETATSLEMFGELAYLSPEQAAFERDVDGRSDVWALGVLLHHCLVGEAPFRSRRLVELRAEIEKPHPTPTDLDPSLDREIGELCKRTLTRTRGSRITARELGLRIDALLARLGDDWVELAPDRRLAERLDAKPATAPEAAGPTPIATVAATPKPGATLATSTSPKAAPIAPVPTTPLPGVAVERTPTPAPAAVAPKAATPVTPAIPIEIESSFLEALPPRPPPRAIEKATLFAPATPTQERRLGSGSPFDLPPIVLPLAPPLAATQQLAIEGVDPEEEWEQTRRSARRRRVVGALALVLAIAGATTALVVRSVREEEQVRPEPTGEPLKLLPSKH